MKLYKVAAAIVRRDDTLLMVRQFYGDHDIWHLPGGKLEEGETFEEAAVREVREEGGVMPVGDPVHAYTCTYKNPSDRTECHIEIYEFTASEGEPSPADPDGEIMEAAFIPMAQAMQHLASLLPLNLPMLCEPATAFLTLGGGHRRHWEYVFDGALWRAV